MRNQSLRLGMAIIALLSCGAQARAAAFYPATYQSADGAMALNAGGNYVEPYFATKALIVAQDGGLDIREAAQAWIAWSLPRQQPSGLFGRYCRPHNQSGENWRECSPADADDSMLALWMQLLYRMAPASGMPAEWQRSVALSAMQLEKLHNRRLGIYHISRSNHTALLMDNIEVYSALKDVARGQLRLHDAASSATDARAQQLGAAIQRIFWDRHTRNFRPSTQKNRPAFYPDVVAQVYPWLADMGGEGQDSRQRWQEWKRKFGAGWIERRYDSHPWGLVALAAEKLGDPAAAACWISQSDSMRGSSSWNVLEEAVWQSLHARFEQAQLLDPQACTATMAQTVNSQP